MGSSLSSRTPAPQARSTAFTQFSRASHLCLSITLPTPCKDTARRQPARLHLLGTPCGLFRSVPGTTWNNSGLTQQPASVQPASELLPADIGCLGSPQHSTWRVQESREPSAQYLVGVTIQVVFPCLLLPPRVPPLLSAPTLGLSFTAGLMQNPGQPFLSLQPHASPSQSWNFT